MSNDGITSLLSAILIIMVSILFVLIIVYIILRAKTKKAENSNGEEMLAGTKRQKTIQPKTVNNTYSKQSIFSFMEFDKIEDNMIVREKGKKFLMVVECQGINYDLMSGIEKNSVEQGFLQFLNTLRYPVQIYVQTRTVNLESGIIKYKERINNIKDRLIKKQLEYTRKEALGVSEKELNEAKLELTREQNLYEYGSDLVSNTERMSLNKNILRKHYYVIIDYMPEDINNGNYGSEEITSMAFSELYTKAQSIISSLSVCGVNGKILDSKQLAELLYVAYNRDEAEVYELDKALDAGYDDLYSTAPNVLQKRMKELDKKIEEDAQKLVNQKLKEAIWDSEEEKRVKQKEAQMDELINQMAQVIIEENQDMVGKNIADRAIKKIKEDGNTKEGKDEKEQKTTRGRRKKIQ